MAYNRMIIGVLIAFAVLAGISAGVQAQSDEGLVAEWHFDEGSGNVVKDSSGNGNDGVIYGATWVEGKYGKALSFDGVDDYVDFGNDASLNVEYITLEGWVNLQTWDEDGGLICKGTGAGGEVWCIDVKNNKFRLFFWKGGKGYTLDSLVIPNGWMHIVATYDGYFTRFYVNGVEKNSKALNLGVLDTNAHIVSLGSRQYRTADYNLNINGIIDEVRIYNRALTAEEIKEHYEQGPTALSITKTATPNSIKQGQTTTITLTVKNTGSTEIKDIEIADTIPQDLTFIDGETSKSYASLTPKDSRQFRNLQFRPGHCHLCG